MEKAWHCRGEWEELQPAEGKEVMEMWKGMETIKKIEGREDKQGPRLQPQVQKSNWGEIQSVEPVWNETLYWTLFQINKLYSKTFAPHTQSSGKKVEHFA